MNRYDYTITKSVDHVGIEERVARLNKRSIKKSAKVGGLKLALSMMDLTTLEGKDSDGKVIQLCQKAKLPYAPIPDLPKVAAVLCVPYHGFVSQKTRSKVQELTLQA